MADTLDIACSECKKQMKVPAELAGRTIRCKACGHAFVVKAAKAGKAAAAKGSAAKAAAPKGSPPKDDAPKPPAKKVYSESEADPNPYVVTDLDLTPRCPYCTHEMEEGDILCLNCGYNTQTRLRASTTKTIEHTPLDWFLWLTPPILCIFLIFALIGFDLFICLGLKSAVQDQWYWFVAYGGCQLWIVIITLFVMFFAARFTIKRLIFHTRPPEKIKKK
jgi:DNA-directed RNA polymerase subunit RPC12/RpoP